MPRLNQVVIGNYNLFIALGEMTRRLRGGAGMMDSLFGTLGNVKNAVFGPTAESEVVDVSPVDNIVKSTHENVDAVNASIEKSFKELDEIKINRKKLLADIAQMKLDIQSKKDAFKQHEALLSTTIKKAMETRRILNEIFKVSQVSKDSKISESTPQINLSDYAVPSGFKPNNSDVLSASASENTTYIVPQHNPESEIAAVVNNPPPAAAVNLPKPESEIAAVVNNPPPAAAVNLPKPESEIAAVVNPPKPASEITPSVSISSPGTSVESAPLSVGSAINESTSPTDTEFADANGSESPSPKEGGTKRRKRHVRHRRSLKR